MGFVVARDPLFVECQFGLDPIDIFLTDQRRNGGDQRPRLGWRGILAVGEFPQRIGGRSPETGWPSAGPADIEFPRIGRVG